MQNKDTLWKSAIEDFFPEMMEFFYPEHYHEFDFSKTEFLDKELRELSKESESSKRTADMLIKLKRHLGTELWLILHIEVQGYKDKEFPKRMFQYFYRIYDKYEVPIEALAIYTDASPHFSPNEHESKGLKTRNLYEFNSYKVLEQERELLEKSHNPFAMVILATYEAIKLGHLTDEELFEQKTELFRKLLSKGFDKKAITKLTYFVKHYVSFSNPDTEKFYQNKLDVLFEKTEKMGLLDLARQELLDKAREEGIKIGEKKGIEIGEKKGIEIGEKKGIEIGEKKGIEIGEKKGIEIGEKKGITKTQVELVAKVLLKGFSITQTADLLELPLDLIKKVYEKLVQEGKLKKWDF